MKTAAIYLLLCLAVSAAPPRPAPVVAVQGFGFEVGRLENGGKAFLNRRYVWEDVPKEIARWQYTRVGGGVSAEITATPTTDGALYVICSPRATQLTGWRLIRDWRPRYTDAAHSGLRVFVRSCRAGNAVPIPKGGWAGCMVAAPKLRAAVTGPREPDLSLVPGVVIDYVPAETTDYIGSPTIAILPDGGYVAAHDFFGSGARHGQTWVFGSSDRGRTWKKLSEISNQHFSTLFVHHGALYLLGVGGKRGQVVCRRSDDGGKTWTEPKDARTGLLLAQSGFHTAPTPVVVHGGRVWRAFEDGKGPGRSWPAKFRAFIMSAPEQSNLLNAANWTCSNPLPSNPTWLDREFEGWLEGNAVVAPDGGVVDVLRVHTYVGGKAAIVRISPDGKLTSFEPRTGFLDLPGGATKFTIRFDSVSKLYWTLTNPVDEDLRGGRSAAAVRNTLALASSPDLRHWTVRRRVLFHPDPVKHAFQYVDWQFDGAHIAAVSRTAYDDGRRGAHNYHDANFFTFHRVVDFRQGRPQTPSSAPSRKAPGKERR